MAMHGTDLIAIAILVTAGSALGYALVWWRLRAFITERQLKIADEIGALDNAIRAMETRLAEHQAVPFKESQPAVEIRETAESEPVDRTSEIAPEIQAVIAAAAVATLGSAAVVRSVKPATSPWTQQGRVLVHGGHNLRVRR